MYILEQNPYSAIVLALALQDTKFLQSGEVSFDGA